MIRVRWKRLLRFLMLPAALLIFATLASNLQDLLEIMTGWQWLASFVFLIGIAAITFETQLRAHKTATALIMMGILWWVARIASVGEEALLNLEHHQESASNETFGVVIFLAIAMALVEIINEEKGFEYLKYRLLLLGLNDVQQFWVVMVITFFLSAILDNMTISIVMAQIAMRMFIGDNLNIVATGIVASANSGGAWSPIGDVTTIYLWIKRRFTALQVMSQAFLPSMVSMLVTSFLLVRQMQPTRADYDRSNGVTSLSRDQKVIIGLTAACFSLTLVATQIQLQPHYGLGFGLGCVLLIMNMRHRRQQRETTLEHEIRVLMERIDWPSIFFFYGILESVASLDSLHVLEIFASLLLGADPTFMRLMIVLVSIGIASAIVDNVPLTALMHRLLNVTSPKIWAFLAYLVGTGGSHLGNGSVAGVVVLGQVKGLDSTKYAKIASVPVFAGYMAGVVVWLIQYWVTENGVWEVAKSAIWFLS